MRNVWKGLIVGAVTGATIGLSMDAGRRTGQHLADAAQQAGRAVREHGPGAASAVADAVAGGADRIKRADLPARARDAAERLADSPAAAAARDAAHTLHAKITDQ